ncbi:3-hydroxybutyryl-CoA dehydrogenase-like [Uloborus diversus]|uniref:3-hydroxybutyryl-CoA dehydrogenase-like n=1 Tax=Uloborus diversus TaxID=327109 RepID=UPI00240A8044|nr:3-hydroxybutyryl-CoA dehydrogenase-like [Uloborus diversus]
MVKVAVVGGGSLGVKIIGELAYHGHEVRVYDRSPESLDKVRLRIQEDKRLLTEDGVLMSPTFLGEVYYMSRLEDAVKSVDFVFEAVPEDLALKQDLFEWVSQSCKADTVIASNSMNLSIDDIVERAACKERCLVVRFLFPVYCIPEVEIVPGKNTSLQTLEKVRNFLSRMGKVAFFRSGKDPLVLSPEERELKKMEFIRNLQEHKGSLLKIKRNVPNLSDKTLLSKGVDLDSDHEYSTREKDCVVCMDEERNCVLHPCHHICTCTTCGRLLLKRQDACPICRKHIASIFRVFHS